MTPQARVASALTALLLVAGCGGGSKGSSDTAPTLSAAQSAAASINLKAADLPGFTGAAHEEDSENDAEEKDFLACVGASSSDKDEVADIYSEDFTRGAQIDQQEISSDVTVVKSASKAKADLKAFQSDKAKACLKTFVEKLVKSEFTNTPGVTTTTPAVTALSPEDDGLDGAFGFQVSLTINSGELKRPLELVIEGGLKKHSAIALSAFSLGKTLSATERDRLWSLLVERTKASAV